jgi:hypothetical protein
MDTSRYQAHRAALEVWRDLYIKYLAADPDESTQLRYDLEQGMIAAQGGARCG